MSFDAGMEFSSLATFPDARSAIRDPGQTLLAWQAQAHLPLDPGSPAAPGDVGAPALPSASA